MHDRSIRIIAATAAALLLGAGLQYQFIQKIEEVATAQVLAAVPLFIFMGALFEASGIASRLFDAIHMWTRRVPGGMAVGTVVMCVIFAATSGVVGATETVVGLLAMRYGYSKSLICGTICAGGSLGTIIPPSVLAVVMDRSEPRRSATSCSACSSPASCW